MAHEIYRVVSFEKVTPFTLASSLRRRCLSGHRVPPSTEGKPNSPLQDPSLFDQVQIDPEVHTLVWPNGADFNPSESSQLARVKSRTQGSGRKAGI